MIEKLNFKLQLGKNYYQVNRNLDKVNIFIGETGIGKTRFLRHIEDKLHQGVIIEKIAYSDSSEQKFSIIPTEDICNMFYKFLQHKKTDFNVSNGEGFLLTLFSVLETWKYPKGEFMLLLDEPETGLDIFKQKRLIPFIVEHYPDIQIICTTHSPFIFDNEFDIHTISLNEIMTKL